MELAGIEEVLWGDLKLVQGSTSDLQDLLRELVDGAGEWGEVVDELFGDDLRAAIVWTTIPVAGPQPARTQHTRGAATANQRTAVPLVVGMAGCSLIAILALLLTRNDTPSVATNA